MRARGRKPEDSSQDIPLHFWDPMVQKRHLAGTYKFSAQGRTLRFDRGRPDREACIATPSFRWAHQRRWQIGDFTARGYSCPCISGGTLEKDARKLAHCLAAIFGNPDGVAQHVEFAALVETKVDQEGHVGQNFGVVVRS